MALLCCALASLSSGNSLERKLLLKEMLWGQGLNHFGLCWYSRERNCHKISHQHKWQFPFKPWKYPRWRSCLKLLSSPTSIRVRGWHQWSISVSEHLIRRSLWTSWYLGIRWMTWSCPALLRVQVQVGISWPPASTSGQSASHQALKQAWKLVYHRILTHCCL